jgi:lipoate-protein ligase A
VKKKCDAPPRRGEHGALMVDELDVIGPEEAFDGPMQMALDEVLLRSVTRPTLRIYRWAAPCVTFGYFQPHALVVELHPGLPAIRRWTGGGIVLHGEDLTFSLMIPAGDPLSEMAPTRFYRNLHGAVAVALGGLLAGDGEIVEGPSCFASPSRDDLMVGGRKVLGGAIRRSGGALLYQGSLVTHSGHEGEILSSCLGGTCRSRSLQTAEISAARVIGEGRYATTSWNQRR